MDERTGCYVNMMSHARRVRNVFSNDMLVQSCRPCVVACHDDHRLAMAAAVLGCIMPFIIVDNKACVSKTYPEV